MANQMRPVHPGEVLRDELSALNLSASALAKALAVPTNRITSILNEQRVVTADTALRLSRFFGTTAEFWMSLQSSYDVKKTRMAMGKKIDRAVKPNSANSGLLAA